MAQNVPKYPRTRQNTANTPKYVLQDYRDEGGRAKMPTKPISLPFGLSNRKPLFTSISNELGKCVSIYVGID